MEEQGISAEFNFYIVNAHKNINFCEIPWLQRTITLAFGPAEPIKQFNTISYHAEMLGMRKMNIFMLRPGQVAESC